MNFEKALSNNRGKQLCLDIVAIINENPNRVNEIYQLIDHTDIKIQQGAAWVLGTMADLKPNLLTDACPYLMDAFLDKNQHNGTYRNLLKVFIAIKLPEEYEGLIVQRAFDLLNSSSQAVAVKIFSMTILFKMIKKYPELKEELILSIENQLHNGTAGIKARGHKILKALN